MTNTPIHGTLYRRRGSLYIPIIGCAMVISVVGLTGLAAIRLQFLAARSTSDLAGARAYAHSAVELGMWMIQNDPSWRTNQPNGMWKNNQSIAQGFYKLEGIDPVDGDLTNSKTAPVELTGTGYLNDATYILHATAVAVPSPLDILNKCFHAAGNIQVNLLASATMTGKPLSTNGSITSTGMITGNVEAVGLGVPGVIVGTFTQPSPAKEMPESTVFALYQGLATTIPYTGDIVNQLISPAVNPWGTANAEGVYFIDAGTSDLKIKDSRIYGTLLVKVASGKKLQLDQTVLIQNYRKDYPAIIVDGALDIALRSASQTLQESSTNVNFNPAGSPYSGATDADKTDNYPNEVQGLVHARGKITFSETSRIRGVVLTESSATLGGTIEIIHDQQIPAKPPMGYLHYDMELAKGSWSRVVLP